MTIPELRAKCKALAAKIPRDVAVVGLLIVSSSASFYLGISAGRGEAGEGRSPALGPAEATLAAPALAQDLYDASAGAPGAVVASKNGTKYYSPDCPGASRISEANKVWFKSADEARARGYQPSTTCKGL